jgi:hypothetical protein
MRKASFRRVALSTAVAFLGVVLFFVVLGSDADKARSYAQVTTGTTLTATHYLYLPVVSHEPLCANPPEDKVIIAGQATVYGEPAPAGVPFTLSYQAHWSYPSTHVLTMTTRNDGGFCSGPIDPLSYCRGMWYVVYQPDSAWLAHVVACEPGQVYTVTAEIGK